MKKPEVNWRGVIPAMTTAFKADYGVDHAFIARHARWMVDHGCTGIVSLGSLGESATLRFNEKVEILKTVVKALKNRAPVVAGIASLSTAAAGNRPPSLSIRMNHLPSTPLLSQDPMPGFSPARRGGRPTAATGGKDIWTISTRI